MKLNAVQIQRFGIFNNFRMPNLEPGFNLIHGGNGSGKSTLARYIRNLLYGFQKDDLVDGGFVEVVFDHQVCRLARDISLGDQIVCSTIAQAGYQPMSAAPPTVLDRLDGHAFDAVFQIHPRNAQQSISKVVDILIHRFGVTTGKSVFGNAVEYAAYSRKESELMDGLSQLEKRIAELTLNRENVVRQIDRIESESRFKVEALDREITQMASAIENMNLADVRQQIEVLDTEITSLRIKVEQNQERVEYVSRPFAQSDSIAILYRRLDEIEQQIRRWRIVHSEIQQHRIELRDEMTVWNSMTVEATEHPYHRSREILREIETRIEGAEKKISDFRNRPEERNTKDVIDNIQCCFGDLRTDLYSLCDELGTQYKSIRHRTAAAELKRLRKSYQDIGENIDSLIKQRIRILEDIRQLDPAGADAITRADHDFCVCAQQDGYLQARRRFVGELTQTVPKVVRVNEDPGSIQLKELENLRMGQVRKLVGLENEKNALQAGLAEKRALRESMSIESTVVLRDQLIQIDTELAHINNEQHTIRKCLEQLIAVNQIPANPLITHACELVDRLTMGEVRRLWLTPSESMNANGSLIQVEQKSGKQIEFEYLGSGLQQQVILALCLATVQQYANQGIRMPMILDDVFVNLDPELIRQTFDVLIDFSRQGTQVLALSSDRTVLELCKNAQEAVFDLPDTNFTPTAPRWNPDRKSDDVREPEFLTPFTTRHQHLVQQMPLGYPQVKYPVAGTLIDHSFANFDREPSAPDSIVEAVERVQSPIIENAISEESRLEMLRICSSEQLNRLSQAGISNLGQLLEINPHQLPQQFADLGISQANIDSWQAISWLLICVPALQVEDAQILSALGIYEPEQLESTHSQQLLDRISKYLNSADGRSFDRQGPYNRETINGWYDSLGQTRSRWRMPSGYSRRNRWRTSDRSRGGRRERRDFTGRQRGERADRVSLSIQREGRSRKDRTPSDNRLENAVSRFSRQGRNSPTANQDRASKSNLPQKSDAVKAPASDLKFYLDMNDQLDAAPSIGPKTAERFVKIGVNTVSEFLTQTAESMAPKINYKRITAEVIRTWQHQARLVCRVPNLRGHDAQLLVACGITEPEDLAVHSPKKLFEIIQPFAESKEGLKIIRSGKQPDLDEITDWINWAQHTRSLQAA